ncbi:MAG: glycosyltransferase family 4 protein [Bacteroidetes bacterium]|nr:glycosyltransferase family 4 protein [Bacteroidota bacterium]MDA1267574.1 glycosyltransferase family 4 protein [Bacteroidota bacterium]
MQKRVLILTYYWPPSGGSGVQRWLKFAKYLPEAGWEPVIFTPENPDFDLKDESLLQEVAPNLEVIRFPIWEPYQLFSKLKKSSGRHPTRLLENPKKGVLEKIAIWLRANLLVPDPRVFWVKPSTQFLNELLKEGQFQAIITTGPPHSLHLIGQKLKQKYEIPWLADFRDPWSQWEFLDTLPMLPFIRKRHEMLEQQVLKQADVVVTISPTFQRDLEKLAGRKVDLITNGYDPADIHTDFVPRAKVTKRLELVYTGIIDSMRNPLPLMQALKAEFEFGGEVVSWTFVGKVSEQIQQQVQADPWLQTHIHFAGYVPHHQVFDFYAKTDALVLILTDTKNAKGNIPGKLFEYLATGLPVLALGDPQGDSSEILSQAGAGAVLGHGDLKGMQRKLRDLYEAEGTQHTLKSLEAFSRKTGSRQVVELLDKMQS